MLLDMFGQEPVSLVAQAGRSNFSLRPYQISCIESVQDSLSTSPGCLAIVATGLGKTEIAGALLGAETGGCLYIVPLVTLCGQAHTRLRLRGVDNGVEQGLLRSSHRVTVACYASLLSRDRYLQFLGGTKLIIVDESHMNYTPRSMHMLQQFRDDGCKIVGMTASPDRMSGDPLTAFYGDICYDYGILQGVRDGWLVPPKLFLTVFSGLDLAPFRKGFGDYNAEEVSRALSKEANVQTICQLIETTFDQQSSLVFCQSIQHATCVQEGLSRRGIEAAIVHSKMDDLDRRRNLQLFESGEIKVILNIGCLTLGYDFPPIKKVYICKPTKSRNKYIQMLGRGTRTLKGVLDGMMTVQDRKLAIANSDKPFFEVYDITDTSRHCDLQTGLTALRPDISPSILMRARKRQEAKADGATLAEVDLLLAEEAAADAAQAAALELLASQNRAKLIANAKTMRHYERDVFGAADATRPSTKVCYRMTFGKFKGTPMREVPYGYLKYLAANYPLKGTTGDAIRKELHRRK